MFRLKTLGALLGVVAVATSCADDGPASPGMPLAPRFQVKECCINGGSAPRIAFRSDRAGNHDIYVMNVDGSDPTALTSDPAADFDPHWSPDGRQIAFVSSRTGFDIYVMDANGSGQKALTSNPAFDAEPRWSPDGNHIAFQSQRDGNHEIYVMSADGSAQTNLTNHPGGDFDPRWAPDGRHIAFESTRDSPLNPQPEIYVMSADGSGQTQLTNNPAPASNFDPNWSPDGQRIAFESHRDGNSEIYVMNADGSGQRALTSHAAADHEPRWSPDGQQIAFTSLRDGNSQIYVMNADGSDLRRLTNHAGHDFDPRWSPDGKQIAFTSTRDGNSEIYVMNADGTGEKRLTDNLAFDDDPRWAPEVPATPLEITAPPDIAIGTAAGRCDATIVDLGTPTVSDKEAIVTRQPSGDVFPSGTTSVTWQAIDAAGNTATAVQAVTVQDVEPPSITPPLNVTVGNDPGQASATVNLGSAAAADNCPGVVVLGVRSDGLALGAPYPVGITRIVWTATDGSGNASAAEQRITVRDAEPPTVSVPAAFAVNATSPSGAEVVYTATARDNVGVTTFACTPASGSVLAIGTQTVTCGAADAAGNSASASFLVTVKGAEAQITDFQGTVTGLELQEGTETSLEQKLAAALASLADGERTASCNQLQALINQVNAQTGKKITAEDAAVLIRDAERIRAVLAC